MNRIEWLTKLEQSATPGPWYSAQRNDTDPGFVWAAPGSVVVADVLTDDHAFLAAMRNALPDLLAVVDALQAIVDDVRPVESQVVKDASNVFGFRFEDTRWDVHGRLLTTGREALARLQGDKE